ncbi:uncharacterized protein LOC127249659 [Andrographis paniculata]|uniref:uncharacterized protein LOC127249659 n=1 Tax=Andrographis paniculata TaxID=175694 RepID=UPI0021E8E45F|nr:uncharacterized protein LOC127249659 [Andrographis paniculata]
MPFLWKRVKSAKISRLVNDHLHISQKRRDGSSLVVETGFPTSLVDLFIKNRDKLKKSSRKKCRSPHPPSPPHKDANDQVIAESPPPALIAGLSDPPLDAPHSSNLAPSISGDSCETHVAGSGGGDASAGAKTVFLKMLLVVFIALVMKRLTVGITLSAFLLFFLEFLGKRGRRWLWTCSDSKGFLNWTMAKVDDSPTSLLNQEVQIGEAKDYLSTRVEEIQSESEITTEGVSEIESNETVMEAGDSRGEVLELKKIKSRRASIKIKMKKLFPKKLSSRKEHEPQMIVIVDRCREDNKSDKDSQLSSILIARNKNKDEVPLSDVAGLSEVIDETATKSQEKGKEINPESTRRYLVLCLIALIGLIAGRTFALLLTLSWCLLLKLCEKLPRFLSSNDKSG